MTSPSSTKLSGLSLDALLAEGLREATRLSPVAWEPPKPEDLSGLLPGYDIVRLIGRGGMGAVYEARQVNLGRRVALKVLPPELGANEAFAERFRREARALGRLEHGNILEVFDFGESTAGHLFYSMQYVEGGDLGARLKTGPLPQGEALRLVKEICAALEAAHAQGVIHRDIKPSNILLTADGTVKVADFGIAVLDDQPKERLTFTGIAVGTLEYAAPEQAAGIAVDTRSDLYSVGVICYEVLTGQLPRGIFDPPSKVNADVAPALDSVVHTAMQSDPARRFQTANDFRAALSRSGESRALSSRLIPLAAAAVVLLAAGTGFSIWKWNSLPQAAAGSQAVAAPVSGRSIVAWGGNDFGSGASRADLGEVQAIAAGDGFTVALKGDGTVAAWGRNEKGQRDVPAGLSGVRAIAAGGYHVLALKTDGTVEAWGAYESGQSYVPRGLKDVQAIAAGTEFSMALKRDGTVITWGANASGQCNVPAGLTGVTSIAAGEGIAAAVKDDGTVVVWGSFGDGVFAVPPGLSDVRTVALGWRHLLALKKDGTVVAWGINSDGQATVPAGLTGVQSIAAGVKHSLALKTDGTVVAWGIKGKLEWGDPLGQTEVPAGLTGVKAIAAGCRHSVALK
ncbi:MAG: hypothetical protein RL088_1413 [Verrucomicrobiota bacterium]|jgi:hypothetical protein